jgi:sigma-E factor negative regulatory protein RseC
MRCKMEETGTVVEIRGQVALVSTVAKGACHSCSARGVCHLGGDNTMVVEAWNRRGARVGDTVLIRLSSRSVLGAAFLLYLVPLLVFLGGFILGQVLTQNQLWAVVWGFFLMAAVYVGIRFLDRWLHRMKKLRPEIMEITSRASPGAWEVEANRKSMRDF